MSYRAPFSWQLNCERITLERKKRGQNERMKKKKKTGGETVRAAAGLKTDALFNHPDDFLLL